MVALVLAYAGPQFSIAGLHYGRSRSSSSASAAAGTSTTAASVTTTGAASSTTAEPTTAAPPTTTTTTTSTTVAPTTTTTVAPPVGRRSAMPGWVAVENARPGTDAWRIGANADVGWIEGYARVPSARPGTELVLYVDTAAPTFQAAVFRMGFYGGKQGRLMWTSPPLAAVRQPAPVVDAVTGMAEARWSPSLVVPVGEDWAPGSYLVKLSSSAGGSSYVPITVRDDAARADLLVMNATSTWQAYTQWGGCSLYSCNTKGRARAVKVSFDRPYARQYNDGSADFLDHELPLVSFVEELGIDAAYATNLDVHDTPGLPRHYRAALSLGHDEYYSRAMRQALVEARDAGTNLGFFGANAVYRHVRFEPAADGLVGRVMVNYRNGKDPAAVTDVNDATVEWRSQRLPEAGLVGIQYLCANVRADLLVSNSAHWIWAGSGVRDGQALPALIGNEADGVARPASPANVEVLASSPVQCGKVTSRANTSYYTAPSGAGVFATGTIWWVCALEAKYCSSAPNIAPVRAATANVLRAFVAGPAGVAHGPVPAPAPVAAPTSTG